MQLDKYSDYVTYWRSGGAAGLQPLMRDILGPHMTASLDLLARNAYLGSYFKTFAGGATGFDNIAADDTFDVAITRAIGLRQAYQIDPVKNPLFCITSPAARYTVRNGATSSEWYDRNKYANPAILVNGEIGQYEDCRFIESPLMTLWNCGAIDTQTTVTASIAIGDGAADPDTTTVDGVWKVGQSGATHYITVASESGFNVGDRVTLHTVRNGSQDSTHVLNGVQWNHAYNLDRRIVAIDTGKLVFDEPITVDWYVTAISPGLYAYVTKARPIQAAIFIWGPRTVVAGVTQPPQTYTPAPIDDTEFIWRFSWDAFIKFQAFYTNRFLVHFFAGPVDVNGVVTNL